MCLAAILAAGSIVSATAEAANVDVLKIGLGDGVVNETPDCGVSMCGPGVPVVRIVRTGVPTAGSVFAGWSGACSGVSSCTLGSGAAGTLLARFDLTTPIPTIANFSPDGPGGLGEYLTNNPEVNTPARFLKALPDEFRRGWILMSRSESLQTGTAATPRILLPGGDGQFVFTVGPTEHASYPAAHPSAIEFMQWDAAKKNFRFHEIVLRDITTGIPRSRGVSVDDKKCFACHSTRNVLNRGTTPGTDGILPRSLPVKGKPNWDAYDSWGGMLPFNRDRIYQGTLEAVAFRKIFNLWTWRADDGVRQIIEQLTLQPPHVDPAGPHGIRRDTLQRADTSHIVFGFDALVPVATANRGVNYSFNRRPGTGPDDMIPQGGRYVTLRGPRPRTFPCADPLAGCSYNDDYGNPGGDEGRGVQLFDQLGGFLSNFNAQRIADELLTHRYATGSVRTDLAAPIALAIAKNCLRIDAGTNRVVKGGSSSAAAPFNLGPAFFDSRNGLTINQLVADTRARSQSLPRRKADIQKINLDRTGDVYLVAPENGLIQQHGAATPSGTSTSLTRLRQEVFRRPLNEGLGNPDAVTGDYVDREDYGLNVDKVAMFRHFLEPLGVSVDKWSMGVRGRSRTYTFADVFDNYLNILVRDIEAGLGATGSSCDAVLNRIEAARVATPLPDATGPGAMPTYTDVQRIFNKSCIECHGGLDYPPYVNYGSALDFSEDESATGATRRLDRSYNRAAPFMTTDPTMSRIYVRATDNGMLAHPYDPDNPANANEVCPFGLMPCGGPPLSKTDIETLRRWIEGGQSRAEGDPHLRTIGGVAYDFQAAGEFVLLDGPGFELQARMTPVGTDAPLGPNGYAGLTSCVSINNAVALRVGAHRVTYQPSVSGGRQNPEGLELRIDGKSRSFTASREILLPSGGRIVRTPAAGGIRVEAPGGTAVVITPGWWDHYQVWYLNVDVMHSRSTDGLMGAIAPNEWLPALPDGRTLGPRPSSLAARYRQLYQEFGAAWRVSDDRSLFDYAAGLSTKDFTVASWPNGESPQTCRVPRSWPLAGFLAKEPQKALPKESATQLCAAVTDKGSHANCVADVMATGEKGFAAIYLAADEVRRNTPPSAPVLVYPKDFDTAVPQAFSFQWRVTKDKEGGAISYRHCLWEVKRPFTLNNCVDASPKSQRMGPQRKGLPTLAARGLLTRLAALKPGAYYWKVVAEDDKGAITESAMHRFEVK
jgi:hypothetical protein